MATAKKPSLATFKRAQEAASFKEAKATPSSEAAKLTVRVSREQLKTLRLWAVEDDTSIQQLVMDALSAELVKRGHKPL